MRAWAYATLLSLWRSIWVTAHWTGAEIVSLLYDGNRPSIEGLNLSGQRVSNGWQATGQIVGSPIVGGQTLYSVNYTLGVLYALNTATGQMRTQVSVGQTSRFATPTLYQTTVFVGTLTGVAAVSIA